MHHFSKSLKEAQLVRCLLGWLVLSCLPSESIPLCHLTGLPTSFLVFVGFNFPQWLQDTVCMLNSICQCQHAWVSRFPVSWGLSHCISKGIAMNDDYVMAIFDEYWTEPCHALRSWLHWEWKPFCKNAAAWLLQFFHCVAYIGVHNADRLCITNA